MYLMIGAFYKPRQCNSFYENMDDRLYRHNLRCLNFVFAGDFNAATIDSYSATANLLSSSLEPLADLALFHNLN